MARGKLNQGEQRGRQIRVGLVLILSLLFLGYRWGYDPDVLLERLGDVDAPRTTVLVVQPRPQVRERARDRAGRRGGPPACHRGHLRVGQVEVGRRTERHRGGGEPRRGGAEADVRRERVLALQPDGVVEVREVADVVDDGVDPVGVGSDGGYRERRPARLCTADRERQQRGAV